MQKHLYDLSFKKIVFGLSFLYFFSSCASTTGDHQYVVGHVFKIDTTSNGDKIGMGLVYDTIIAFNKTKDKLDTTYPLYGIRPIEWNGQRLYTKAMPVLLNDEPLVAFKNDIVKQLPVLDSCKDQLTDIIVDTNGKVRSYNYSIILSQDHPDMKKIDSLSVPRHSAFTKWLFSTTLKPVVLNGKKVPYIVYNL